MIIILIVGDHHTRCWACSRSSKAEAAIAALQEIAAATSKVMRDGKMVILKSEDLVPGDVVILEAGDAVPADGRIIECASMKIEEAALTGESVPVNKLVKVPEPGRGEGYSPGRPEKHDVHGLYRGVRPRKGRDYRNRYGYGDGQDRFRAVGGQGG